MTDEARVQELIDELLGSTATPEEVCQSCPELLPEVRKKWRRVRRLNADLDALFPPPNEAVPLPETDLPPIPGYEVETILGRGGMGIVFRARHLRLNRLVALKMLLFGACATRQERARFQREAAAVARLQHPNIVQVFDVGDIDGRHWFTMEYVANGSLAQKLAGAPQPTRQAAQLVATLAGAVQTAHERGIVHRDLKPANVLLAEDGTPKISDFGLARQQDDGAALTQTGMAIGTPSYMAPEQARGRPDAVGPAVDVYALGAILYELLTGRPPFRAATSAETVQQVISQDPAPPSRLNDQVPRDLETICLKCMHKEPGRRYVGAATLADDLRRFVEGRPIQARPVSPGERLWRWSRRNPTAAALLATALALVGLASGGGVWFVQQRAERQAEAARHDAELRNEVSTAVAQAASLRKGFHFREAKELLEQTRQRLEPAGPSDLRRQVDQGLADLDLAERLDAARVKGATAIREKFSLALVDLLYASAFADAGLGRVGDDIEIVAANVQKSAVSTEIIATLDDWAAIARDAPRRDWLLAVARKADPDPARASLRQPDLWNDGKQLTNLPEDLKVAALSPEMAAALGCMLRLKGMDAVPLLTAAQRRARQDFRLNLELGLALEQRGRSDEALGHFRAALAVRPQSIAAYIGLGTALSSLGRREEAAEHFEEALQLDPGSEVALQNLGVVLQFQVRVDEAIGHFEQALRIDPSFGWAHANLGAALAQKDRLDEAIDHFEQALRLDPDPNPRGAAVCYTNLGHALHRKGRLDEALKQLTEAVRLAPGSSDAQMNLGNVLRDTGRLDEAIDHMDEAVRLNPKNGKAHHNLAAVLLEKGRLEEAIDRFQQSLKLDPKFAMAQTGLSVSLTAATRAALWAAAGHESEKTPVSEPERAGLRAKSLGWLRAYLELTAKMHDNGQEVFGLLTSLQTDPYLASVRDRDALAKLPDAEREQWQQLWANVATQAAADPLGQGRVLAARGDWARAADCYAQALKQGPTNDGHFWFEYAALLLLSGDRAGYEMACSHLIEKCGKPGGPRAYHVARACTLAADAVADAGLPGRLAEKELRTSTTEFWSLTEQGALACRAGNFREAAMLFEQSLKADAASGRAVVNWVWLALANHRLGKPEEAQRWLDKARSLLDHGGDKMPGQPVANVGLDLHNWLEAHVMRREAETVLASTP
jgi:serine/threonine-protein kinase